MGMGNFTLRVTKVILGYLDDLAAEPLAKGD